MGAKDTARDRSRAAACKLEKYGAQRKINPRIYIARAPYLPACCQVLRVMRVKLCTTGPVGSRAMGRARLQCCRKDIIRYHEMWVIPLPYQLRDKQSNRVGGIPWKRTPARAQVRCRVLSQPGRAPCAWREKIACTHTRDPRPGTHIARAPGRSGSGYVTCA